MNKFILFGLVCCILLLAACQQQVTSFEECVQAGNPVMESMPRQCSDGKQVFTEQMNATQTEEFTTCPDNRPEICTMEYNPVCGLIDNGVRCVTEPCANYDAVTFSNGCSACSEQNTLGHYQGTCEKQQFVVCDETTTGVRAEEFARDSNGTCVDICPANFDTSLTQTGIKLCVLKFTQEDINQWPECSASNATCNCVKTTQTTQEDQVDNTSYRCVPETYASKMLHSSGITFLDEEGNQGTVIA